MRVIVFDIDGTLADLSHRLPLIKCGLPDWDAFFDSCSGDAPIGPLIELARIISAAGVPLVLCTGRPERSRAATLLWLDRVGIVPRSLYMRADGDHRRDTEVKREMLDQMLAAALHPILAIEDRNSVVAMWRAAGISCLQCADRDY